MKLTLAALVIAAAACCLPGAALATNGDCGQPQTAGAGPKTTDALATLKKAVGSPSACDGDECICDVNADTKVNTSDALRVLKVAVGQDLALECDCACVEIGEVTALAAERSSPESLVVSEFQVQIEARIIAIDRDALESLSLDLPIEKLLQDLPRVPSTGTNGSGQTVALRSFASGGPNNVNYLVLNDYEPGGALPILNENFLSPFTDVKTLVTLPTDRCVTFPMGSFSLPQNLSGMDPVVNPPAFDAGFGGDKILAQLMSTQQRTDLISLIKGDNRNKIINAPIVSVYSGQSIFHMLNDVEPALDKFTMDFKTPIQAVTPNPFGNFTGFTLDFTPRIDNGKVSIQFNIGTRLATFFYSTAFLVDGLQTDAEIPLHKRSLNSFTIDVMSGQTLLLGGLKYANQPTPEKGIPLFGDLPLVGSLFTHKLVDPTKQSLMVFITPTIIEAD